MTGPPESGETGGSISRTDTGADLRDIAHPDAIGITRVLLRFCNMNFTVETFLVLYRLLLVPLLIH